MIYELIIRNPKATTLAHWPTVPWLKGKKTITFKPGLNVVIGPNGSGKSTLLTAMAMLMHCHEENWPRVTKSSVSAFMGPRGFADGLLVEHDGNACRYLGLKDLGAPPETGVREVNVSTLRNALSKEARTRALHQMSSGQATIA